MTQIGLKKQEGTGATNAVVDKDDGGRVGEDQPIYLPDVDVYEESGRIRLVADVPGLDDKSVNVTVHKNVLTIAGRPETTPPAGYTVIGQEHETGSYRRDFTLPDNLDAEKITARVRNGVLEVMLPKREQAQTRRIPISG